MRNCCVVIKQIKEKVPEDLVDFHKDLDWCYNDASYKAPEEVIQWERLSEAMYKHIGEKPTLDWQFEAISILTTKSIEELKQNIK